VNVFKLKYIFNTVKLLILILLLFSKTSFASDLTQLFSNLKNASDHEIAMKYEKKIWHYWHNDGSNEKNNAMMKKCLNHLDNGALKISLDCFITLKKIEKNWAEPVNKIATIKFLLGDYDGSLKDIKLTLLKEPRHFGAIAGSVQINIILKKYDRAIKDLDRLKEIHPHISILSIRPFILKLLKNSSI